MCCKAHIALLHCASHYGYSHAHDNTAAFASSFAAALMCDSHGILCRRIWAVYRHVCVWAVYGLCIDMLVYKHTYLRASVALWIHTHTHINSAASACVCMCVCVTQTATENYMCERLVVDDIEHWAKNYKVCDDTHTHKHRYNPQYTDIQADSRPQCIARQRVSCSMHMQPPNPNPTLSHPTHARHPTHGPATYLPQPVDTAVQIHIHSQTHSVRVDMTPACCSSMIAPHMLMWPGHIAY